MSDYVKSAIFKVSVLTSLAIMVVLILVYSSQSFNDVKFFLSSNTQTPEEKLQTIVRLRRQRDELSQMLNEMKQVYGQQSCEILAMKNDRNDVSQNGGWCKKASNTAHVTDKPFALALSSFLKGKTVGSFGDGPGEYKKLLESYGEVVSYTAYDGAPYCEEVTAGRVKFLDLTAPQYRLPIFDWGLSTEVAEHIPAKYENIFLDNLVRHAREGIILSWAVIGQGGLSHVNNKALEDVVIMMSKRGFSLNRTAGEPLRNSATLHWLQKNVHVYYRISMKSLIELDA